MSGSVARKRSRKHRRLRGHGSRAQNTAEADVSAYDQRIMAQGCNLELPLVAERWSASRRRNLRW
jgi:hypothetical protein